MTRRTFISALSALMAAAAVDPTSFLRASTWKGFNVGEWYFIECRVAMGVVEARINGKDVTDDARAIADIGRFMCVDTQAQVIRFSSTSLASQSGFLWRPAKKLPESFNIGFSIRVQDNTGSLPLTTVSDLYATDAPRDPNWGTDALGYARTTKNAILLERGHESVRIEAIRAKG